MNSGLRSDAFARARELFEATSDIRYVAIAIGKADPNDIPKWAISACQSFAERVADATPMELGRFGVNANAVPATQNDNDYRRVLAKMDELQSIVERSPQEEVAFKARWLGLEPHVRAEIQQTTMVDWRVSFYAACKDLGLTEASWKTMIRYYESELQTQSDLEPDELNMSSLSTIHANSKAAKRLRTADKASRHPRRINQRIVRRRQRQLTEK